MTEPTELTKEELEQQDGEPLPDREAMSIITPPRPDGVSGIRFLGPPVKAPGPDDADW